MFGEDKRHILRMWNGGVVHGMDSRAKFRSLVSWDVYETSSIGSDSAVSLGCYYKYNFYLV